MHKSHWRGRGSLNFGLALLLGGWLTTAASATASPPDEQTTNTVIAFGSEWRYLDDGSDQGSSWTALAFDDGSWASGPAQLGYGDGDEATVVSYGPEPNNKYITTYFRGYFFIEDPTLAARLTLRLVRDDGAVVHVNGTEVFRTDNMPGGSILFDTTPLTTGDTTDTTDLSLAPLVAGTNVMAVEMHQANGTSSDISFDVELIGVFYAPTNFRPTVSLTSPVDGLTVAPPADVILAATAGDRDGTVTNVAFYANGNGVGQDASEPFTVAWNGVAAGDYALTAVAWDNWGLAGTSTIVNVTASTDTAPPVVTGQSPAPGTVNELTALTVTFSKAVIGVDAGDLLVNSVPATGVSGAGADYAFTFAQPAYGAVNISWAAGHNITDVFTPPHAFDRTGPGATWQHQLVDIEPPQIFTVQPLPGATVAALNSVTVSFTEPVTGVSAGDLLVNSVPAISVSGGGAGPYTFSFAPPAPGAVLLQWAAAHGIRDQAGNGFAGPPWSCVLDPETTGVVISEIMYHPSSEDVREEYIELYNRSATDVNAGGWRLNRGVDFSFPSNTIIRARSHLVVAADVALFQAKYPGVADVIGNWQGILSNSGENVEVEDAQGRRVDLVPYADEGDWAVRRRGPLDGSNRDWIWFKEHDGLGSSLELVNPALPNEHGQNWAASLTAQGTPGAANSVARTNVAPFILEVTHFPIVPTSAEAVMITARLLDELPGGQTVTLFHREALNPPPAFSSTLMQDDGLSGDGVANDGLYGAILPARPNNAVIEYYVEASDAQANARTWPAAALPRAPQTTPLLQEANALYQVDDNPANVFGGVPSRQPVYKIIMTEFERANLAGGNRNSDAQRNCAFISLDGTGVECRQLNGIRFRGHGSRGANPPNYRLNLRSDTPWQDMVALNLNTREVHVQHLGATLANLSGAAGPYSRAVQVRVNNANLAAGGSPMYGSYAANEAMNSEWAERHVPFDNGGNIYKAAHDIAPGLLNYRGEDPAAYRNTYFKGSNVSEDDWTDLIGMLRVVGIDNVTEFTTENVEAVINVEQWLTHIAVMSLFGNNESGLNTGNNDDYYYYRGVVDPRFILVYWDLDQILGQGGSLPSNASIWTAALSDYSDPRGISYPVFDRLMHWPDFEPIYYRTLQRLLDTTFSQAQFDALVDQTLGDYVPTSVRTAIKNWMNTRRNYVQGQIAGQVTPAPVNPVAVVTGEPRSPTPFTTATLTVGGTGVTHYRFRLNEGTYGPETPVSTPISLTGLPNGSSNLVSVVGRNADGTWQSFDTATTSQPWVVNTATPTVRLSEVLARNVVAVNHAGTFPDLIELYNEGGTTVNLSGLSLTDAADNPRRFVFPANTLLAAGAYLTVYADNPNGTPGLHLGFGLNQDGDGVYLFSADAQPQLLDSVEFGRQVTDLSIGRLGAGRDWSLTQPTFGGANVVQPLGDPQALRINEWLAAGTSPYPDDFVELYNPGTLPVSLGGLSLSDVPIASPGRHRVSPLNFVVAGGWVAFIADGQPQDGPEHLDLRLSAEMGEIGLFDADLSPIDRVIYGSQSVNVSRGRCPNGAPNLVNLPLATPGAANVCPTTPPDPQRIPLIAMDHVWKYEDTGTDLGVSWRNSTFNDDAWASGPGLLGSSRGVSLEEPLVTPLSTANGKSAFYFRARFNVDPGLNASAIQLLHIVDDGAVFYLNGAELLRYNMPSGTINYATPSANNILDATFIGPVAIPASAFQPGENVMAVEVHNSNTGSPDMYLGVRLEALILTNTPALAGVVINEVMANNGTLAEADGTTPDWVELYNPSSNAVDLAGMSFTDQIANPQRWVFPSPTVVAARGYVLLYFDADKPVAATNTGFGLRWAGDNLYLFSSPADGGGLLDRVAFGVQPADWSLGRVPDATGAWQLTLATPREANQATPLGAAGSLRVNEWMAAPASGDDWFELYNPSPQPVALNGLYLTDDLADRVKYPIAPLSFIGTGSNAFLKIIADGNLAAGADHVSFALSAAGEAVGIYAANGGLIDGFSFGPQQSDVSQGRLPDGDASVVFFPVSATPGEANYLPLDGVVINEVLTHSDPPLEDAIELFNPTAQTVDISGWWLSDARSTPMKYQIPPDIQLAPGGFYVVYEMASFNNGDVAPIPFALSSSRGDEVYLHAVDAGNRLNGYRTSVQFDAAANGVSFGRHATSTGVDFVAMSQRTFGRDNPQTVAEFRLGSGLPNASPTVGPVVVNEIMYHPPDVGGLDNVIEEFIELHNPTAGEVPLFDPAHPANGWRLRDAVDFDFTAAHRLPPGGYLLVVSFDPVTNAMALAQFEAAYGANLPLAGPYQGKLDNSDEVIRLYRPDTPDTNGSVPYILVEKVNYFDQSPWPTNADGQGYSLQRVDAAQYGNEVANWTANLPTPAPSLPNDPDGDGLPTTWELQYQLNPNDPSDALLDSDGDGRNNREEYLSGTNPRDPSSRLQVETVSWTSGTPVLRFLAVAGKTYSVLYATVPTNGTWHKVADVAAQAATQMVTVSDPGHGGDAQRFYQVVTPAVP